MRLICETCIYGQDGKCTTYCEHYEGYKPAKARHGHWTETHLIMLDKNGDFIMSSKKAIRCSECFRTFDMENLWARNFCPGCGTKMDEPMEVKDEQID